MKLLATITFISFISYNSISQQVLEGRYCYKNKIATACIEFSSDLLFTRKVYSHMGLMFSEKGKYRVIEDSLFMEYDYNYPEYKSDVEKQKVIVIDKTPSQNNYIILKIHVRDVLNEFVIPEAIITINNETYFSDYDGNLIIKLDKGKNYTLSAYYDDSPPVFVSLKGVSNYILECVIDPDLKDLSKEYHYSYKYKLGDDFIKLISINDDGKKKRRKYIRGFNKG